MHSYKLAFWIWDSLRGKGREMYTKLRFESHSKTFGNRWVRWWQTKGAARMKPWPPPKKLVKIFRWCFISISTVGKQTEGTVGLT